MVKKSGKKLSSASSVSSVNSASSQPPPVPSRSQARSQLLETRKIMRSGSGELKTPITLDVAPPTSMPLPHSASSDNLDNLPPTTTTADLNTSNANNLSTTLHATTLDVAKSAERLMMSGYAYDVSEAYPHGHPLEQFQLENVSNAINQMSDVVDNAVGPSVGVGNPGVFVGTQVQNIQKMKGDDGG
eukprot:CAMPEP_0182481564 /NCGR_PEP_ID=MMETSP1319-20130603/37529_1 /TAXON_ID=172717 /ORGANISM="Bolidomonas pacifica, Strain RCC208" /LENGTH=186 /DNA_ID=CAMNT_0024683183 /DNA_START=57 /DNA_END=614 /DNA_ORIENTATION=+